MSVAAAFANAAKFFAALAGGDASAKAGSIAGHVFTVGDVKNGLAGLKAFPLADLEQAANEKFMNLGDDLVVAEDLDAIASDLGVPYAGLAGLLLAGAGFIVEGYATGAIKGAEPGGGVGGPNFSNDPRVR